MNVKSFIVGRSSFIEKAKTPAGRKAQVAGHFVGAVLSLFGPSGADQREAQDGYQNGQLWLGGPPSQFATRLPCEGELAA